jgi:tRNA pseudouridine38-40 synthase
MSPPIRTLRLVVAYDGAAFAGWQRQAGHRTVQGDLEEVLAVIEGAPVHVAGAGRTDAGVHAAAQVASVRLTAAIAPERLVRACNAALRDDVRVLAADEADGEFHARIHARGKSYRYFIWHAPADHPSLRRVAWHVPQRLSLAAMQEAADAFVGEHDFRAFQARGGRVRSTVRRVWASTIEPDEALPPWMARPDDRGRLLVFAIAGSGFLRHQVRAMAGTLVQVGRGRMTRADITRALAGAPRAAAGPTAPAHGLHLWRVHYGADVPDRPKLL